MVTFNPTSTRAIHLAEGRFLTMKRRIPGGDTLLLGMARTLRRAHRSIEKIDGRGIGRRPRLGGDALDQVDSRLNRADQYSYP